MSRSTSFTLDQDQEKFLDEQLASGRYRSSSEVMREALRRMAEDERKAAALSAAIDAGLVSPIAPDGVFDRVRARIAARRTQRAR